MKESQQVKGGKGKSKSKEYKRNWEWAFMHIMISTSNIKYNKDNNNMLLWMLNKENKEISKFKVQGRMFSL